MNPGATFDRVYRALKERIARGELGPGEHLEPALLGRELASSITPVRDALHRLVGERIIEAPNHNGFRLPLPSEAELRELYDWSLALLELALRRADRSTVPPVSHDAQRADPPAIADLFAAIGRRSGNGELAAAIAGVTDRLASLRALEGSLLGDQAQESRALAEALDEDDPARLRSLLRAYHARRRRAVVALVALLRAPR